MKTPNSKKFKVNDIFCSIQGEGWWTGTPTIFVRLSGCNLSCAFCDTQHEDHRLYTAIGLYKSMKSLLAGTAIRHICITGGEPTIQNLPVLLGMFEERFPKFTVQIETNGTNPVPRKPYAWVTCSPKIALPEERYHDCDELKFLIGWDDPAILENFLKKYRKHYSGHIYIQPMWGASDTINQRRIDACKELCLKHNLNLSLQIHKLVGGIK